jgi:hypothetical protein
LQLNFTTVAKHYDRCWLNLNAAENPQAERSEAEDLQRSAGLAEPIKGWKLFFKNSKKKI